MYSNVLFFLHNMYNIIKVVTEYRFLFSNLRFVPTNTYRRQIENIETNTEENFAWR